MTTIEIELPEATAGAEREAGLLTTQELERLLNNALKRKRRPIITNVLLGCCTTGRRIR